MEHHHPTSFNKGKSGQKHFLLIATAVVAVALPCYLVLHNKGEKAALMDRTAYKATIPDYANKNQGTADQQAKNIGDADPDSEESRRRFSLSPFNNLDTQTKKLLLSANYSNGAAYQLTRQADRAQSTICYGDFNADGQKDVAIVIDNIEKQNSRLLIICSDKATREKYLAFAEDYPDKIKINAFRKGTKIIMNHELPEALTVDSIIANGEDVKLAVVYDKQLQKFKTFYQ